jgi:hypothetical protein
MTDGPVAPEEDVLSARNPWRTCGPPGFSPPSTTGASKGSTSSVLVPDSRSAQKGTGHHSSGPKPSTAPLPPSSRQSLGTVANGEVVATEAIRKLVGSIGLVCSVPITTWLAVRVLPGNATRRPMADQVT